MVEHRKSKLPSTGLAFLNYCRVLLNTWAIGVAQAVSAKRVVDVERAHQVDAQLNHLVATIKDEYAAEAPHGRHIAFVDVPNHGMVAIATFILEGFGDGSNVHQFLAVFGPPNDPGPSYVRSRYALSALTEVGDGCGVDVRGVRVSRGHEIGSLMLTLPTFTMSSIGWRERNTHRTYALRMGAGRLGRLELR